MEEGQHGGNSTRSLYQPRIEEIQWESEISYSCRRIVVPVELI